MITYSLGFDQITTNFVVKVFNRLPRDVFSSILFLFCFKCQLNEDLLQLLIDVVDTQLFESVFLLQVINWLLNSGNSMFCGGKRVTYMEDLETINIQHTNRESIVISTLQTTVHSFDNPIEHSAVECFSQGITRVHSLKKNSISFKLSLHLAINTYPFD